MALPMNLFNNPGIQAPAYKVPLTAKDRAQREQQRLEKKRLKQQEYLQKRFPEKPDLSAFHHRGETQAVFVGQNVYVKPSYLVSMPEFCYFDRETGEIVKNPRTMTEAFIENQKNLADNQAGGKLSRKAVTGLRNSINWLCVSARKKRVFKREANTNFFFKINFVTLTLPDTPAPITSDVLQKQLLNPFLTYMRKYQGLRNYVWRLEFQANGKLHVHLSADTFLHHRVIRDAWNRLLEKNGYLKMFLEKNGHLDPNSTDVHATRKIKNMAAYLAKYMSKKGSSYTLAKPDRKKKPVRLHAMNPKAWYRQRINFWNSSFNPRPIKGRIWGCSAALSKANKLSVHVPADQCGKELRCLMDNEIPYQDILAKPKQKQAGLYDQVSQVVEQARKIGEVYFLNAVHWFSKIDGKIKQAFADTRRSIASLNNTLTFELT
jgi:hypothetical protein